MATVTIGVPVFNGEKTLARMLDSLLSQTFADFEIIISDNASTDRTADIANEYARRDQRVRCMSQAKNIGPERNFKSVLDEVRSPFFMWSAADDLRSPEFLKANIDFLLQHEDYVASTSPNCFEGQDQNGPQVVRFELSGSEDDRIKGFFRHCWVSHGIFYSVIRTEVLRGCEMVGKPFLGTDWAIDLYLASKGKIHRSDTGMMVSGAHGISNSSNAWRAYRDSPISWLIPFHKVSLYTLKLVAHRPLKSRMAILKILFELNAGAAYNQLHAEFYPAYFRTIRPWIHWLRGKKA